MYGISLPLSPDAIHRFISGAFWLKRPSVFESGFTRCYRWLDYSIILSYPLRLMETSMFYRDHFKDLPEEYEKLEKVYFSFEDWMQGRLPWSGWFFGYGEIACPYALEGVSKIHILPENEFLMIKAKQKEIFENQVERSLNQLKDWFDEQYLNSFEKEELLQSRLHWVDKVLKDKSHSGYRIPHNGTWSMAGNVNGNEIAKKYEELIVNGNEGWHRIKPNVENGRSVDCSEIDVIAFYRFKKYLEEIKDREQVSGNSSLNIKISDIRFLITNNSIIEAIKKLHKAIGDHDGLTMLESRYNQLRQDEIDDVLADQKSRREHNKIKKALLKLVREVK